MTKAKNCEDSMYAGLEKELLPYMIKKSSKLATSIPTITFEDAMQEGRLAILEAIRGYKPEKDNGNGPGPYVRKLVKHAYVNMAYVAMMKSKVPHVVSSKNGESCKHPSFPISLDALLDAEYGNNNVNKHLVDSCVENPEDATLDSKMRSTVGKFTMKMYNRLSGVDYKVFKCKVHPPADFLDMMYLEGVNFVTRAADGRLVLSDNFNVSCTHIEKYLKLSKNTVGWSLYKIRELFMEMARNDDDFSEIFENLVIDKRWPMVHTSVGKKEALDFKRRVFRKRQLDTRQTQQIRYLKSDREDSCGKPYYSMTIKAYAWGSVIVIKKGKLYYTMVIEGRFNEITGDVFGLVMTGAHVKIPLAFYREMKKELKDA